MSKFDNIIRRQEKLEEELEDHLSRIRYLAFSVLCVLGLVWVDWYQMNQSLQETHSYFSKRLLELEIPVNKLLQQLEGDEK